MSESEAEQLEEIEALEAIFPDCFTLINSSPPFQYKVNILPNVEGCGENHGKFSF